MVFIILLIHSVTDMKYKNVIKELTVLGIIGGILLWIQTIIGGSFSYEQLFALCPGSFCLFFGKITKESIGYGDGMILLMLGFFYSWEVICVIFMKASMFAVVVALLLLIVFQKNRNYEIPFVPFLTIALWMEELCI